MTSLFAGIDIGGTSMKSLVVDCRGRVIRQDTRDTGTDALSQVSQLAAALVRDHPDIRGIGIVSPGTVDEDKGTIGYASNVSLSGVPIPEAVSASCGRPVKLGHDGRGAGLAENLFGAARGSSSSVVIPIGTGISASLHFPDMVWQGHTFMSGEIGHIPIYVDGEPCACGQRGCTEVYASAKGIAARYEAATGRAVTATEVESLLGSDPNADAVWARAVEALALVLAQLTLTLDPECIVIGGGLSGAGETLLAPLRSSLTSFLKWRRPPTIVASALGPAAGQWGAAVLGCRAAGSECYLDWQP